MYISRIHITHIANSGLNSKTAFHTHTGYYDAIHGR